jgi:hypothetical protein
MIMRAIWTRLALGIATLALTLASGAANAWKCDFLTGGGFIINPTTWNGAKANFGVGGGCKQGTPTWGHLEYIDHGNGLNVHWTSITAYIEVESGSDSKGRPIGVRGICGTARTNQSYGDVHFLVRARDAGEPGTIDEFDIRLVKNGTIVYSTEFFNFPHKLNDGRGGGGNIQLHKPNPSTTGNFSDLNPSSCPANFPGGPGPGA